VTGIALDHTDWLGPTREAIGFEKAGIFRAGKPANLRRSAAAAKPARSRAAIGADLRLIGRDFGFERHSRKTGRPPAMDLGAGRRSGAISGRLANPGLRGPTQLL
jgi:dihydrofolate synthase/folylpolyglutamate synthase